MTWFSEIAKKISVNATGKVADNLEALLMEGKLQSNYAVVGACLDTTANQDLTSWVDGTFANWFHNLTAFLEVENNLEALEDPNYSAVINRLISSLEVARGYYAQQADDVLMNSLKIVAIRKAMICETLAAYVGAAYLKSLEDYGDTIHGKTIDTIEAYLFEGSKPEPYKWKKKNVIVNYQKFENVAVENSEDQNPQCPEAKKKTDYLPWAITGAFFLIAWSASAKN
jgi:hypothetical protein